ncbi:MAG: radical SAM protein [Desulfobacteraceae bacterium]|nr:radical SAM protein [Desulfobacteraceae bacterium]
MGSEPELSVSELFLSLQGESTYAGLPCVFIRLGGCNLRCRYCDARYTYEEAATVRSLAYLLDFAGRYPEAIVEITGGEPLLQPGVIPLMAELVRGGRTVLLETNGSLDIAPVPEGVVTIMDVKCPEGSGADSTRRENLNRLRPQDELKFVLASRADYEWSCRFLAEHRLLAPMADRRPRVILFSPVTSRLPAALLAAWLIADRLPVRLQLQLHKVIWPDSERGV